MRALIGCSSIMFLMLKVPAVIFVNETIESFSTVGSIWFKVIFVKRYYFLKNPIWSYPSSQLQRLFEFPRIFWAETPDPLKLWEQNTDFWKYVENYSNLLGSFEPKSDLQVHFFEEISRRKFGNPKFLDFWTDVLHYLRCSLFIWSSWIQKPW